MTNQEIVTEFTTDPASIGYAEALSSGNTGGLESLVNAMNPAFGVPVEFLPRITLIGYLDSCNVLLAIMGDTTHASCAKFRLFFSHPDFAQIPMGNQQVLATFQALVTDGLMTAEQLTGLRDLAIRKPASRAEFLWGSGTNIGHTRITEAFNFCGLDNHGQAL